MALTQYLLAGAVLAVLTIISHKLTSRRRSHNGSKYKLPPGRPGYPLLGNVLELPNTNEHLVYQKWARELNTDIMHINAAGTNIIVLNSIQMAEGILDGRSAIHSSRPKSIMLSELMGWDWGIALLPYGNKWKERRKMFQKHLAPSQIAFLQPHFKEHIANLVVKLRDSPAELLDHARYMIGALTISFTFGLQVLSSNDPYIDVAEAANKYGSAATVPGAFYIDLIPALRYVPEWFPGAGFKRKAKEWGAIIQTMRDKPFEDGEKQIASGGVSHPSFLSTALDNIDPDNGKYERDVLMDTAGMVFSAASDTTTSALATFFLAMVCFPEVQKRAQEELDRVLGGRLPEQEDEDSIPYVTAIVKEILRWKPPTPIGVPHLADKDDIFHDYLIPQGTIIVANQWAMLYNEEDYPEPEKFKPERFLDDNGGLNNTVRDPSTITFGFGRRVCPGSHIARSMLWLTAATILSLFDIKKAVTPNGKTIEPSMEYEPGLIIHPRPFECDIKPRSKQAEAAIQSLRVPL